MYNFKFITHILHVLAKKTPPEKNPYKQGYPTSPLSHRILILIVLALVLTILLTPQIPFKYPDYTIDTIAESNIKADREFLVEKKTATEQRKMEAINDTPSVYDYDGTVASRINLKLENAFSLLQEINWETLSATEKDHEDVLQKIRKNFESTLGVHLDDKEFEALVKTKFSPQIANAIKKLIDSAYANVMLTNVTFLQQEKNRGIIIRDSVQDSEREFKNLSEIRHITDAEIALVKAASNMGELRKIDPRKVSLTISIKLLKPNLIFNNAATEMRRQEAIKDIKRVYITIQKNEMLVREGEKITMPVLDKLDAYYRVKGQKQISKFLIIAGMFCIIIFCSLVLYQPGKQWLKPDSYDLFFLVVISLLQILVVKAGIFLGNAVIEAFPQLTEEVFTYFIPFTICPMLASLLTSRNLAFILTIFLSLMVTFLFDNNFSIFLYSFLGGVVASQLIVDCRKRTAFFRVGLLLGLVNMLSVLFLNLAYESTLNFSVTLSMTAGLLGGIFSSLLVSALSPIFEALFQYTTDIKLLELANLNQPIFQRMIMEAPGTYHHSIVVASMVESAAESIHADALLAKVSAYYHDIGKMKKPLYFIENQRNGENKHDKLTPKMSSLVIVSHIKDGCEMAYNERLGRAIINIIREHHGTSLVSYFYDKAKKDKDPSIRSLPDTVFRYPGPKPQTREAGLVLLGDVVEASSRSLSNPTPSRIKSLVRERILRVFSDGQLDECELTLRDLNRIAESFTMILNGIFHHRIEYPEPVIKETAISRKEVAHDNTDRKQTEKNKNKYAAAPLIGK